MPEHFVITDTSSCLMTLNSSILAAIHKIVTIFLKEKTSLVIKLFQFFKKRNAYGDQLVYILGGNVAK